MADIERHVRPGITGKNAQEREDDLANQLQDYPSYANVHERLETLKRLKAEEEAKLELGKITARIETAFLYALGDRP